MQKTITPRQKKVLDFIKKFSEKNGYSPSLSEISKYLNKSLSTAQHFVEELQSRGYLHKDENVSRGLVTTSEPSGRIFLLGYIAAGKPIDPIENPEPIDIPISMLKTEGDYYALQVKGDSMIEDNILDNDIIVIRHQQTAENGDRVVAVTEDGATLKVFRKQGGKVYLEPRNSALNHIYPKKLEIRGKFVGLIRGNF